MTTPNEQPVSDTPRSDSVGFEVQTREYGVIEVVPLEEARQLERELHQANLYRAELVKCKERVIELEAQWKEYCGEYDKMMARWKDEKGDIAARCGFPWEFGVGIEPWCAADELRKERDSLRAKVQELERQWQPIATAPKDGTEILGWRWDSGVLIIRWTSPSEFLTDTEIERMSEESSFQSDWFYSDLIAGGRLEGDEAPTHWMPLPSTNAIYSAMLKPTSAPEHSPENRTTDP